MTNMNEIARNDPGSIGGQLAEALQIRLIDDPEMMRITQGRISGESRHEKCLTISRMFSMETESECCKDSGNE